MFKRIYRRSEDPNWRRFREFYRRKNGKLLKTNREIRNEYDGLAAMAKRGKLQVLKGQIRLPLGWIVRKDKKGKKTSNLGRFILLIYPKKAEVDFLKIGSLTTIFSDINRHPLYIYNYNEGRWITCLGNIAGAVKTMIKQKEFLLVADLMIEFLERG